jgi:TrmH family RNA methyltransferase
MDSLPLITSLQNPLVKQIRKLHQAKERHRQGVFLLEGTHVVQAACEYGYSLQTVCYTPEWQTRYPQLWEALSPQTMVARLVSETVLKSMATTVNPDGVMATALRPDEIIGTVTHLPEPMSLGVVLERVQDPGNLGTIIRTTAAAGGEGLWLSADSVDLDHPKVLRASAGQWFQLSMGVLESMTLALNGVTGTQIVATTPTAEVDYWDLELRQPTLFLVGNEGAGLSPELLALAHHRVKIPLAPGVESLNVAIATALLLYEAQRQRRDRCD